MPVKRGFKQFVDVVVSPNSTTTVTGYCIDVFDEAMKNLAYPVPYRYVPFYPSSESYEKLVDLVRDGKADIVVGDVTTRLPGYGDTDTDTDTAIRRYGNFPKTWIRGYVCIYIIK